jgi:hypothetical protein
MNEDSVSSTEVSDVTSPKETTENSLEDLNNQLLDWKQSYETTADLIAGISIFFQ